MRQIRKVELQWTRYRMTTQFIVLASYGSAFATCQSSARPVNFRNGSFASLARSSYVRFAPVATLLGTADARLTIPGTVVRVAGNCKGVIQAPELEPRIVRYELSDYEWAAIKPFFPTKPRAVERPACALYSIFWALRSGVPRRDLPETFGPYTTCYNRFVRWGRAGVWDQIMDAVRNA